MRKQFLNGRNEDGKHKHKKDLEQKLPRKSLIDDSIKLDGFQL